MDTITPKLKKRGEKGEGSIRYIKRLEKWEARLSFGRKKDGSPDRRSAYAETKTEAKKLLRKMKDERDAGVNKDASAKTMTEYFDNWLKKRKRKIKENSYIRLKQTVENNILPELGCIQLENVTSDHCENVIDGLIDKGLSYSTIKKAYEAMNGCFEYAMVRRDIIRSPMIGVEKPTKKCEQIPEAKEMMPFDEEECKRFITEAQRKYKEGGRVYRLGWLFILILNTGMRIGEALALNWSDVDLDKRSLSVDKTTVITEVLNEANGTRQIKTKRSDRTKTHAGKRVIGLTDLAVEALLELRSVTGQFESVAATKSGGLVTHRNILRTFHCILKRIILEQRGIHNLRHTFASQLFAKKVDVKIISKLLGHKTVQITMDTYIHILEEQTREAIQVINFLGESVEQNSEVDAIPKETDLLSDSA